MSEVRSRSTGTRKSVLESDLKVGMMIRKWGREDDILTILGEVPPCNGYKITFLIHSALRGEVFEYNIPQLRVPHYPFLFDAEVIG